jgi:hypothetical protein
MVSIHKLTRLVERDNTNLDERNLTGAVFLDLAKVFDIVYGEGLLYKLTILNFSFFQVKTVVCVARPASAFCCAVCVCTTRPRPPPRRLALYADDRALSHLLALSLQPWRWRQHVSLKLWHRPSALRSSNKPRTTTVYLSKWRRAKEMLL